VIKSEQWICFNCGVQRQSAEHPIAPCLICADERESISHKTQRWTNLAEMDGMFENVFTPLGGGVTGIHTLPLFGIGQEVFLLETGYGCILWDCLGFIDTQTLRNIALRGDLAAIVISHPHFFGSMVEWSCRNGCVPIYVHKENQPWIPRWDRVIELWDGEELQLNPSVTIIRTGGHFPGSCILHWADGADGKGALFTSDTILPVEDRRWVSFMYSYPNLIPLSKRAVQKIVSIVARLKFDRIYGGPMYGGGGDRPIISSAAKEIVLRSAKRYIQHLES